LEYIDSFVIENERFFYFSLDKIINNNPKLEKLPISLKILLEANIRNSKNDLTTKKILDIFTNRKDEFINFYPSRVVLKEYTAIPTIAELAKLKEKKLKSKKLNLSVDLLLQYMKENEDPYKLAKWCDKNFSNLRVIPPGSKIVHPINLEYLSTVLHIEKIEEKFLLFPETIAISDYKENMTNSFGVLGHKLESVDALATILGMPLKIKLPKVVGIKIVGKPRDGVLSSDFLQVLLDLLQNANLDEKIVEFYGDGLKFLTLENRTKLLNKASSYNALCSFFAIDEKTILYYNKTRQNEDFSKLVDKYLKTQKLFLNEQNNLEYDENIDFDLSNIFPRVVPNLKNEIFKDKNVVLSLIDTSNGFLNPFLIIHCALVAKKAYEKGFRIDSKIKTFFKTDLTVYDYLANLDLLKYLEGIGFYFVNTNTKIEEKISPNILTDCSISSGTLENNYVNENVKLNYTMSASLVVIHSLIGSMKLKVFDKLNPNELWPEHSEVLSYLEKIDDTLYKDIYKNIFLGNEKWQDIIVEQSESFPWNEDSTFIQVLSFKEESFKDKINIENGEILALFNSQINTKNISSNIQITPYISVASFLQEKGVKSFDFGTFEDRRGCSKLMVLGAFDTNEIKNMMVSKEGAFTKDFQTGEIISFYEKSKRVQASQKDLIIIADENYGIGDTNDWAAKATKLLGVKAIIAKSFGENHRKDLIKMGILPLQFIDEDIKSLNLKGYESISIKNSEIKKDLKLNAFIYKGEQLYQIKLKLRLDNEFEIQIYKNGGLVPFILKGID